MRIVGISLGLSCFFVCACEGPPRFASAPDRFYAQEEEINLILTEFLESDFRQISMGIDTVSGQYDGSSSLSLEGPEYVALNDLLIETGITAIRRRDEWVDLELWPEVSRNRSFLATYVYGPEISGAIECRREMESFSCGICGVPLSDNWLLDARWYDHNIESDDRACRAEFLEMFDEEP